ncbi:hypothetical protein [Streptomyces sp. 5-10]|uniref:hypothetical protein n=1 Tax=Streptomyces sp. 5-10 TaxID=878925 RepID=UPI00168A73FC|nr:hypothetical protein [Streptomyces sp. 5-10]MBD3004735.1 hypothetical protein [Streptomyces sp. 5-10]
MRENDPKYDGTATSPPDAPDYWRLVEVTDMTVQWDVHVDGGTRTEVSKRFDVAVVDEMAMKRADETKGLWSTPSPPSNEIFKQFIHVWAEGLMHGIVFLEQRKQTSLFGKLPDHNLLAAADSIIGGRWGEGDERGAQWASRIDAQSMAHVAVMRSIQAIQILKLDHPSPETLRAAQASHWEDGFIAGFLFAELGGHREE